MVTQEELEKMSPEEIAELQRQNCPFCKIIKGEIPSAKVYEDDTVLAILDINPSKKGHVLVMPKEHIPILPVCPPDVFKNMFQKARFIAQGLKKAVLVPKTTLFIASGAIAGQQAAHFLFHLVPREEGDGLDNFSFTQYPDKTAQNEALAQPLAKNLTLMMQKHAQREGRSFTHGKASSAKTPASASQKIQTGPTDATNAQQPSPQQIAELKEKKKEEIARILEENPQAKQLLITNPQAFKEQVEANETTKQLFAGVDIEALAKNLATQKKQTSSEHQMPGKEISREATSQATVDNNDASDDNSSKNIPKAQVFLGEDPYAQKQKVFAYFKEKPKAQKLLVDDPDSFIELLSQRPDVQPIFKDVNIRKLSQKLREAYASEKQHAGGTS